VLNSIFLNICQGILIINLGYVHSWTGPKSTIKRHIAFFSNFVPIVLGLILGTCQHEFLIFSLSGIIGCGIILYTVSMLVFPSIFEYKHDLRN
jgi:hypothetical protein